MGCSRDISDQEWARWEPFLEPKQKGRPRNPALPGVKTAQKGGQRGYTGGKKKKGRKRPSAVDIMGNILAVAVHAAGISESRGAHLVLIRLFLVLPHLAKILVDGGYKQGVSTGAKPCSAMWWKSLNVRNSTCSRSCPNAGLSNAFSVGSLGIAVYPRTMGTIRKPQKP